MPPLIWLRSVTQAYSPEELTESKTVLVSNAKLAQVAAEAQLHQHLNIHSKGLAKLITRFVAGTDGSTSSGSSATGSVMGPEPSSTGSRPVAVAPQLPRWLESSAWGAEDDAVWRQEWWSQTSGDKEGGEAAGAVAELEGVSSSQQHGPKVLADVVEALVAAVLVDSSTAGAVGSRSSTAAADASYYWAEVSRVLQRLLALPG